MSGLALRQLLDLRRLRERQASAELARRRALEHEQEARVVWLREQQGLLNAAIAQRIAALYRDSLESLLSRGDLDLLVAAVDHQYRLEADMRAAIHAAESHLATLAHETEEARRQMQERSRAVQKLEQLLDEMSIRTARQAEVFEEAEAERPFAPHETAVALP
jgi:hypothetical protein